jgi:hypothetical protein
LPLLAPQAATAPVGGKLPAALPQLLGQEPLLLPGPDASGWLVLAGCHAQAQKHQPPLLPLVLEPVEQAPPVVVAPQRPAQLLPLQLLQP